MIVRSSKMILISFHFSAVYMILILGLGTMSTFLSAVVLHHAYSEDGRHRRFFSLDCIRSRRASIKNERKESLAFVNNGCSEVDKTTGNGVPDPNKAGRAEADKVPVMPDYYTNFINPKARDLVDKIDVIAFWIFLLITILLFIVIVAVLFVPRL